MSDCGCSNCLRWISQSVSLLAMLDETRQELWRVRNELDNMYLMYGNPSAKRPEGVVIGYTSQPKEST